MRGRNRGTEANLHIRAGQDGSMSVELVPPFSPNAMPTSAQVHADMIRAIAERRMVDDDFAMLVHDALKKPLPPDAHGPWRPPAGMANPYETGPTPSALADAMNAYKPIGGNYGDN